MYAENDGVIDMSIQTNKFDEIVEDLNNLTVWRMLGANENSSSYRNEVLKSILELQANCVHDFKDKRCVICNMSMKKDLKK